MANILSRYGIKEVADVTFYTIKEDAATGKITPDVPVLYLDTLKVSTIEQTAESSDARGGKGNAALISWDYGKEITVTLEDALYSAKSLALMYGDLDLNGKINTTGDDNEGPSLVKTVWKENLKESGNKIYATINNTDIEMTQLAYYNADGSTAEGGSNSKLPASFSYAMGYITPAHKLKIDVSANGFPGTYYITGDTYARSETTGKDDFFQFVIPKAKVLAESNTITLEAEGDPTVFSMNLKVLRPKDGVMMKLIQYDFETPATTNA